MRGKTNPLFTLKKKKDAFNKSCCISKEIQQLLLRRRNLQLVVTIWKDRKITIFTAIVKLVIY